MAPPYCANLRPHSLHAADLAGEVRGRLPATRSARGRLPPPLPAADLPAAHALERARAMAYFSGSDMYRRAHSRFCRRTASARHGSEQYLAEMRLAENFLPHTPQSTRRARAISLPALASQRPQYGRRPRPRPRRAGLRPHRLQAVASAIAPRSGRHVIRLDYRAPAGAPGVRPRPCARMRHGAPLGIRHAPAAVPRAARRVSGRRTGGHAARDVRTLAPRPPDAAAAAGSRPAARPLSR